MAEDISLGKQTDGPEPAESASPSRANLARFWLVARAAVVVFWASVVITVALAVAFAIWGSLYHGLGALVGGALVIIDAAIFRRYVSRASPGRVSSPLWKTVVKFYVVSVANMLACFLVIRLNIGSPLTFLAGLGVFMPAVGLAIVATALSAGKLIGAGDHVQGEKLAADVPDSDVPRP
ncbi:MAG: ATP synthase subunit I [Deltaproteobacteria bacterium]|jgi:hypothetical protein|nr:ATP synthase subunit I [Deltaproteobacteria bacterium]